ncbi:MAG: hypothetical protein ACTHP8_00220 [Bosea sp. (in: a-proteobacteria)]|uniref:hypothetical protein n=1 Tax=Bosea sp. (in: a-proteobacteria) TaxID=1871050 RepID=UPI003F7CC517
MSPDPLNRNCFFPPKLAASEQAARGFSPQGQNGGMSHIQRVHLSVGQNYYRFCDSARFAADPLRATSGGWWADHEVFTKVRTVAAASATMARYARSIGEATLSYAAKLHFAIPYEWGDCGVVVIARLTDRLDAFRGRGLTAYVASAGAANADARDGAAKYTPLQDPTISQLFIPELHLYFGRAFSIVRQGPASSF